MTLAADVSSRQIIDFPNVWHGTCDDTAWPVDLIGDMSWVLRYGDPATIIEKRMTIASFVSSYNYLVDPNLSQTDAIAALKRARKVAAHAHGPKEGD